MRESERAAGWLDDPDKLEELARRLFARRGAGGSWPDLSPGVRDMYRRRARVIVSRTIEVARFQEELAEITGPDDLVERALGHGR